MSPDIRLIACDLDGTLLTSDKRISSRTEAVLRQAAAAGIEIVPATGRFYSLLPHKVRELDFIRYAITINGAAVCDIRSGEIVAEERIPLERALEVMDYFASIDGLYDCYVDNAAYVSQDFWEVAERYAPDEHYYRMIRNGRTPVEDLRAFVRERGHDIQKTQIYAGSMEIREQMLRELPILFPDLTITSSARNNVEVNARDATKGNAMLRLAAHLSIDPGQTMAFGDSDNDRSMIRAAGIGVAMANAAPTVRLSADHITLTNDEDGVAAAIEELLLL